MVAVAAAGVALAAILAGCGSSPSSQVPSLNAGNQSAGQSATPQLQTLHAAAQCIRDHGVPNYQDPVVDPNGNVYTDQRSLQEFAKEDRTAVDRLLTACRTELSQANFNPQDQPPASPALVQAGVRAAQCLRAHGLPNVKDPSSTTEFVPGHGFSFTSDELPPGGKTSGVLQQAFESCRSIVDEENNASTLANLSHG
jgi:hypothetical protein